MTAIFITATGPDVGKTLVAASLIRHLQTDRTSVDVIKPIVCGYEPAKGGDKRTGDTDRRGRIAVFTGNDRAHVAMALSRRVAA